MRIFDKEQEILAAAKKVGEKEYRSLWEDKMYGTAYAFWSNAVHQGYADKAELEAARSHYGELWHYRGD